MKINAQVLDADYFLNGTSPVVRIFGKTAEGRAVCLLYEGFAPYFYIAPPAGKTLEKVKEELAILPEIRKAEETEKFLPFGYQKNKTRLLRLTCTNPQDVPKLREKLVALKIAEHVYEADIMFKYRFMVDHELYGMRRIEAEAEKVSTQRSKVATYRATSIKPAEDAENAELRYMAFDIECLPGDQKKPLDARKDQIIIISVAFSPEYRGKKTMVLVARPFAGQDAKGFANEKEMLQEFLSMMDTYDPDVVTGYNVNSFDFPYLLERLRQNKLPLAIGRCEKPAFERTYGISKEFVVQGRVVVDPYQILKRDPWVKFHRYDLNTVANHLLGEGKLGVEYGEMAGLWNGGPDGIKKLVDYARQDAVLSMKLVVDKGALDKFFELSKISGLLLQDAFGGQTRRIETMLLHEFRKRGFVMPPSPSRQELQKRTRERKIEGLKGATVLEPEKGLHAEGCILVLDFKSLYPSIMRTFNVSPDSVALSGEEGYTSPSGARFVPESVHEGIFPYVLAKLLSARHAIKKQMKGTKGEERRIMNAKQLALKDISNSFYGYTGYIRARLYMIDVANTITACGRENIEKTRKLVEENFDVKVVYGDTDSIFVKTKMTNLDDVRLLGEQISRLVTERLPGHLELEFEKVYRTFLILTKKRYAGWKFEWSAGAWSSEIEMRGIETVRRDWCPLVTEAMTEVINIVLKEGDLQKAIDFVKEILGRLRKGEIPMEKLTIVKGITQSLESYKGLLPHIEAAKKMEKRSPKSVGVGDRIGFVITKGSDMLSKRAEDPVYAEQNGLEIDSDYYIENQLFPPVERIFSAVGVGRSELLGGGRQYTLSDMVNGAKKRERHDISVDYKKEEVLEGWDSFVCSSCKKLFPVPPLSGRCECGSSVLISFQGKTGNKAVVN